MFDRFCHSINLIYLQCKFTKINSMVKVELKDTYASIPWHKHFPVSLEAVV